jgi:hypothetical protein
MKMCPPPPTLLEELKGIKLTANKLVNFLQRNTTALNIVKDVGMWDIEDLTP